jgi:hypothetical protein
MNDLKHQKRIRRRSIANIPVIDLRSADAKEKHLSAPEVLYERDMPKTKGIVLRSNHVRTIH